MATTYATLQTEIGDFLDRDDLTAVIPTFIQLAEAQMNRIIRHWQMEQRATGTFNDGYFAVPTDWVETIRLSLTGSGTRPLELISHMESAKLRDRADDSSTSGPYYYSMEGGFFRLYPTPAEDTEAEILYIKKIPSLTDAATTNWLLTNHPDVYLYGSLIQSAPYLKDDNRMGVWASLFQGAVQAINQSSDDAKYSGSGLRIKIRSY